MSESILIVAAHPDDEALGCGGSIAKWADHGAKIHVAFLADGVSSRGLTSIELHKNLIDRRAAAKKSCDILGVESISFYELPDNRLDTIALLEIIQLIEGLIFQYMPTMVLTHHAGDLNIDHRRVYEATITACRPQKGCPVKRLLTFEVPSSTEWQPASSGLAFTPNWFVDISATLQRKLAALNAYALEMHVSPHPRSLAAIENLSRWRGATVGVDSAEAFVLSRWIE